MNVLGSTRILGVFGHPVSHSLSPQMQNAAIEALGLDYVYVPMHVLPNRLEEAVAGVRALDIRGVNLTIPHKERVIEFLDDVSEAARRIGSVNTIINDDGRLRGESTDGAGFMRSVEVAWGNLSGASALVLGAGGSAKAVSFALIDAGLAVTIANRTRSRADDLVENLNAVYGRRVACAVDIAGEDLAESVKRADLLVNTTSLGMSPDTGSTPISPEMLHSDLRVYDLVYNPLKTRLLTEAEKRGAKTASGLDMLVYQGAISLEMWTGREAPVDIMKSVLLEHFDS